MQCLLKLGGAVIRAPLTRWQKLEAMFHLGGYVIHPLMLLMLALVGPLMLAGRLNGLPMAGLGLAMFGMPVEILLSQRRLYADWSRRLVALPVLMLLGIGIAVSNTRAVLRAFSRQAQPFERTPKFHAQGGSQFAGWGSIYTLPIDGTTWIEMILAAYSAWLAILSLYHAPALSPFMALYALGLAYVAGVSLWQARLSRTQRRASTQHWGLLEPGGD
jgi:hypothetical protein